MDTVCTQAENLLKEKNIQLSAEKRAALSTYDAETQVRWIVNPLMEWILQQVTNQIVSVASSDGQQQTSKGETVSQQQSIASRPKNVCKCGAVIHDDDDDDMGFGLFD